MVDAHPLIRGVARLACEEADDLELVGEAADAGEALNAATALSPHVVILDLDLPDGGGQDTLARLKEARYPGAVLALSQRSDGAAVLDALKFGVQSYLLKGAAMHGLADAVRRTAAGERIIDPGLELGAVLKLGEFARKASLADAGKRERHVRTSGRGSSLLSAAFRHGRDRATRRL